MSVIGVSMFRNEADVARYVVRHMLDECDRVIVADNCSTDETRDILAGIADTHFTLTDESSFAYRQSETMMRLAAMAPEAEWIVPFDADEWWDSPQGRLRDVLPRIGTDAVAAMTSDMIPAFDDDPHDPNPFTRIRWARASTSLWSRPESRKAAFRPGPGRVLMQGNHGIVGQPLPAFGPLRVRHFPFRTYEQAAAKLRHGRAAVLALNGELDGSGTHWKEWGAYSDDEMRAWWADWTRRDLAHRWTP